MNQIRCDCCSNRYREDVLRRCVKCGTLICNSCFANFRYDKSINPVCAHHFSIDLNLENDADFLGLNEN